MLRYLSDGFEQLRARQAIVGVVLVSVFMNVLVFPYPQLLPVLRPKFTPGGRRRPWWTERGQRHRLRHRRDGHRHVIGALSVMLGAALTVALNAGSARCWWRCGCRGFAHAADCGHATVQHEDHIDYVHDGHRHARHEAHYDEH